MTQTAARPAWRKMLLALLLLAGGCAGRDAFPRTGGARVPTPAPTPAPTPDHTLPGVVAFDVAESGGTVHLLLGGTTGTDPRDFVLSFTRSVDGGATWSEAVVIPTGHAPPARMHRGDDPRIAVSGQRVMALWTARGDGPYGSGPIATALSGDGGRTWSAGPAPVARPLPASIVAAHTRRVATLAVPGVDAPPITVPPPGDNGPSAGASPSATPAHAGHAGSGKAHGKGAAGAAGPGYRFPAAAAGAEAFHVVWIHAAGEERSLRHARLPFGAAGWSEPTVVDPHVCACCWNVLKVERDGTVLALYRDQQPSDMSLAVSRDAGRTWASAGRAGRFDWHFDGCPHVGGGVATVSSPDGGQRILATVWTGNAGATGAYVLSRSGDGTWSRPAPLTSGEAPGRNTDVAALPGTQRAAAAWDQAAPGGGQCVFAAFTADGGQTWSPRRLSPPGENASYPRVVPLRDRFLVLWTSHAPDGATSMRMKAVAPE